ncbi:hypothetical protein BDC45DRAFT_539355 [Circinella umbellata]|nr:hypothetical protein BDC45DRAFT_539355 [Circinella umbellata]
MLLAPTLRSSRISNRKLYVDNELKLCGCGGSNDVDFVAINNDSFAVVGNDHSCWRYAHYFTIAIVCPLLFLNLQKILFTHADRYTNWFEIHGIYDLQYLVLVVFIVQEGTTYA